ncbi:MAG: hypothetical protein KC621_28565, partial [Myxococcales bacterium]|nr:hypothetical protein [Myxococcales bacterium]
TPTPSVLASVEALGDAALGDACRCVSSLVVTGDVTLRGVSDTSGLACLTAVGGDLTVLQTPDLEELGLDRLRAVGGGIAVVGGGITSVGLSSLETVGGEVQIEYQSRLEALNGLGMLREVGGDLDFEHDDRLASTAGLERLERVGGSLRLFRCPRLGDLDGFASLGSVGEDLVLQYLQGLGDISGLRALRTVGRDFGMSARSLTSLDGLEALVYVGRDLYLYGQVEDITALGSLQWIGRDLAIETDNLRDVRGLGGVPEVRDLYVERNRRLTSLAGLDGLTRIRGAAYFLWNDRLPDFSGLDALRSVERLYVGQNRRLTSFAGLQNLEHLPYLFVEESGALASIAQLGPVSPTYVRLDEVGLTDLRGLENVIRAQYIWVHDAPALTSLDGLDGLEEVDGDISLWHVDNMSDISALRNLRLVTGTLDIAFATSLRSLDGLQSLVSAGAVDTSRTPLVSLDGLSGLQEAGGIAIWDALITDLGGLGQLRHLEELNLANDPSLISLEGLDALDASSVLGLRLMHLPALHDLHGLPPLEVLAELWLDDTGLTDLSALQTVSLARGRLQIDNHADLHSLTGLQNIRAVGTDVELGWARGLDLTVTGNAVLTDVTALHGVRYVGGDLVIEDNPVLAAFDADALASEIVHVEGWTVVRDNGP